MQQNQQTIDGKSTYKLTNEEPYVANCSTECLIDNLRKNFVLFFKSQLFDKKRLNSTFLRIQISGQRLVLLKSEKVKVYIESIALSPENLI